MHKCRPAACDRLPAGVDDPTTPADLTQPFGIYGAFGVRSRNTQTNEILAITAACGLIRRTAHRLIHSFCGLLEFQRSDKGLPPFARSAPISPT
jgi:hypothetical protein